MDYNEKDYPKKFYNISWNGVLFMLLRLNPDELNIKNVEEDEVPYAHIKMLDCKRGEEWKLSDYQKEIDNYLLGKVMYCSLLSKEYISKILNEGHEGAAIYTLDEEKAKTISKEIWERENPTGDAYDVVSYWDDCDRKIINPRPLPYSEAQKLCGKFLETLKAGSLYHYTVEVHR